MNDLFQLLLSGMASGAIYALAALGFTLLWQASGTINFAQGEFVMLPAFLMLGFNALGLPLLLSFAVTCVVAVAVLGWAFKRGIADPLLKFGNAPGDGRLGQSQPVGGTTEATEFGHAGKNYQVVGIEVFR